MRAPLEALLAAGPLLGDGGTGTSLVERGVPPGASFEALNLENPDLVADVHRAFVAAGARLVETNTFGANGFKLAAHGLADRVADINRAGVAIARRVADAAGDAAPAEDAGPPATAVPGHAVVVSGSVGPLGVHMAPYGRVQPGQARAAFREQIEALADAGADLLSIETQVDLAEAEQAVGAARDVCDLPVLLTATFTRDDRMLMGPTPEQAARRFVELGADAIGVNCSQGPAQVLRIIEAMRVIAGDTPIVARPNAGGPQQVGGRLLYPATAQYFAEYAEALVTAGARIIGGCCGTGPAHIEARAAALERGDGPRVEALPPTEEAASPVGATAPSALAAKLEAGRFVIAVEMDPPRSASAAPLLASAESLADAGADAITIADSPMARLRMSPWAACRLIQEHTGIDTVLHFPTRGRNLLRVQGDLLAAHALGIRNVFVCMGDPTAIGDYPEAASDADVAPSGLIALITQAFNRGTDRSGASIGEATRFLVGCALNLNADDLERECRLLRRKIDSGADFALTQPVYDVDVVTRFRAAYERRHGELRLPLLVGILPPVSVRHAAFLHNEVPGIRIPDDVQERLRRAGDHAAKEGVDVAGGIAEGLVEHAGGIYLMPPFGRFDLAVELIDAVHRR
jgi:methionine synthase / methylenetetrahydrofolate reductase(NADPH)